MNVLMIALVGPRDHADACSAALNKHGWTAIVGDDGPGNSGLDNTNARMIADLGDFKVVDVEVTNAAELDDVQHVAGEHEFRLRLHAWVTR